MRNMLAGWVALAIAATAVAHANAADEPVADKAAAVAGTKKVFTPPDGWRPKKRGQFTVYCRKQSEMGTRLPTEKCYDEQGIRDMLAAQRDDREKVDQMRRICSSQATCGAN
jgi:hypothetical protein